MSAKTKTILRVLISFLLLPPIVSMPAFKSQTAKRTPRQRDAPPSIESFVPSTFVLALCPFFSDDYLVKLEAKASDPDGDVLTYRYLVTGGRIIGQGPVGRLGSKKGFGSAEGGSGGHR